MHPPLFCFAIIYESRSKVRTRNGKLLDFCGADKRPPECHPERSKNPNPSSSSAAKDLDWDFCEVEVLVRERHGCREPIQNRRGKSRKRFNEEGICDGFFNACSALVTFSKRSQTDYCQMLLCTSRRVRNLRRSRCALTRLRFCSAPCPLADIPLCKTSTPPPPRSFAAHPFAYHSRAQRRILAKGCLLEDDKRGLRSG